ncbi:MAG: hypothetical protein ABIO17_04230 [Pseudoxanthomonas sp.]
MATDACLRAAELAPLALEVSRTCFATYRPDLKNASLVFDNKRIQQRFQQQHKPLVAVDSAPGRNKNADGAAHVTQVLGMADAL